jgi:drug/metabolite transporter (DMT)-like permease
MSIFPGSSLPKSCEAGVYSFYGFPLCAISPERLFVLFTNVTLSIVLNLLTLQLMNIGLLYTPVSIYQMTRGALVLFVGILSVIFLHRRLWLYQHVLF